MREQKLPFRYDREAVVTPAVDYVLTRADVDGDNLALMGMSLGGYLATRAAAFEHYPAVLRRRRVAYSVPAASRQN